MARSTSPGPAGPPPWAAKPVAVLVGGPMAERWYFITDLQVMRAAAHATRGPDSAPPPCLHYQPVKGGAVRAHPVHPTVVGAVWRYTGDAAS